MIYHTASKLLQLLAVINGIYLITATCKNDINLIPTSIYEDLRCIPKYENGCIKEYDCSHIYNRPKETCHFKGKILRVGEKIDNKELNGVWDRDCVCTESLEYACPELTDGCAEDWVSDYPGPECYLRYELDSYCAADEICPPFTQLHKCEVEGTTYREGDKFIHPHKKCTECVCNKHFNGKLESPFCQPINCTAELGYSKFIDNHCAPFYGSDSNGCCPDQWICKNKNEILLQSTSERSVPLASTCKYGERIIHPGDYFTVKDEKLGEVKCECNIPPFLHCRSNK